MAYLQLPTQTFVFANAVSCFHFYKLHLRIYENKLKKLMKVVISYLKNNPPKLM